MATRGIELEVYKYDDPTTKIDTLNWRKEPTYLEEIKANGAGSFKVSTTDPQLREQPTLLDYRNVIKVRCGGQVIGAYLLGNKESATIREGERGEEYYQWAGEGLLSWFDDATVYPSTGLKRRSGDVRYFNFATEQGDWYNSTLWKAPVVIGSYNVKSHWGKEQPSDWPSSARSTTKWIWGSALSSNAAPRLAVTLFRYTLNVPSDRSYVLYFAADDWLDVYLDGEQIVTSDRKGSSYSKATKVEVELSAGTHIIGVRVQNWNKTYPGPAGLLAAFYYRNSNNAEVLADVSNNGANWKAMYQPSPEPCWTAGEVMLKLLNEAEARGVQFPGWLTPTFTSTTDSQGNPWPTDQVWSWDVGTSMSQVISTMADLGIDVWIDPDTLELNMAVDRGVQRTTDPGAVEFRRGKNLKSATTQGVGKIKNALAVKTPEGWVDPTLTKDDTSISKYGRLESGLSAETTISGARTLATAVFRQRAQAEEGASYSIIAADTTPWVDFGVGDWVLAPNDRDVLVPRRVVSISIAEGDAGEPVYTLEFDTIFRDSEDRFNRYMNKTSGGSIGGGMASTNPNVVANPPTWVPPTSWTPQYPLAPTGVAVESAGYWSATGMNALASATVSWLAVTENTDGTATQVGWYEVWAHPVDHPELQQVYGRTEGTSLTIQPFEAETEWTFYVRAFNDESSPGDYSTAVTHKMASPFVSMPAPSAPILSSHLGVLTVGWDGLMGGGAPPLQFRYLYALVAPDENGAYTQMGGVLNATGRSITVTGLTVGQTYWVKLRAVDGLGVVSADSEPATITITGVDLGDLDEQVGDAIEAAKEAGIAAQEAVNLLHDSSFEESPDGEFWTINSPANISQAGYARTGTRYLITPTTSGVVYEAATYNRAIPCISEENFYFGAFVAANAAAVDGGLEICIRSGPTEDQLIHEVVVAYSSGITTANEYFLMAGTWVAPEGDAFFKPFIRVNAHTGATPTYRVDDLRLLRRVGELMIVEGAVVSESIAADVIRGVHIQAGAIDTPHLQAGSVVGETIAGETITGRNIAGSTITGDHLEVGTVQTQHLSPAVGGELDISANDSVTIIAGQVDGLGNVVDGVEDNLHQMQTYYEFGANGAIVTTPGSPYSLRIANDRIELIENGTVISYWDSGQMVVADFVGQKVILGNHQLETYGTGTVVRAI